MINPYKPWNLRKTPAISSVAQWELQLTEPEQKCGVLLKCDTLALIEVSADVAVAE